MKNLFNYTLLIFIGLTVLSCKKKVADVNKAYVGSWSGSDSEKSYSISIESNSKASYFRYNGNGGQTEINGNARIKGHVLKIFTKKFKIDQPPLMDTTQAAYGSYTMVLDGITFRSW